MCRRISIKRHTIGHCLFVPEFIVLSFLQHFHSAMLRTLLLCALVSLLLCVARAQPSLQATSTLTSSHDTCTITWSNVPNPSPNDIIGLFYPAVLNVSGYATAQRAVCACVRVFVCSPRHRTAPAPPPARHPSPPARLSVGSLPTANSRVRCPYHCSTCVKCGERRTSPSIQWYAICACGDECAECVECGVVGGTLCGRAHRRAHSRGRGHCSLDFARLSSLRVG